MWPDAPLSVAGLGLGYGIAIAVGVLVLVSTIMLASYVCVRAKAAPVGGPLSPPPPNAAAATDVEEAAAAAGLDGPVIDVLYPKFVVCGRGGGLPEGPCPICLADYESGEALRRGPECGHCFHAECVDEWLRVSATCPLCRSSPVPSAVATPVGTPLSELIPLAAHAR